MVDHTGVGIEVGVTVDAMSEAIRKNAAVEGAGDDVRSPVLPHNHFGWPDLLLAVSLTAYWAARVAVERFFCFDFGGQNVGLPSDEFPYHIGVHGLQHARMVAIVVSGVHGN